MKVLSLLFLAAVAAVVVTFAVPAHAAEIGYPVEAIGHLNYTVGAGVSYTFNKEIEAGGTLTSPSTTISEFEMEYSQAYAKVTVGLTQFVNVYTKLGMARVEDSELTFASGSNAAVETEYDLLWGVGFAGACEVEEWYNVIVGAVIECNRWNADVDTVNIISSAGATNISGTVENSELQTSVYLAKRFEEVLDMPNIAITPYIAGIYDYFNTQTDGAVKYTISGTNYELDYDLDGDKRIGIAVGANIEMSDSFALNIEGRLLHERTIAGGLTYKF